MSFYPVTPNPPRKPRKSMRTMTEIRQRVDVLLTQLNQLQSEDARSEVDIAIMATMQQIEALQWVLKDYKVEL